MKPVFADTGYWIALLDRDDSLHALAREFAASALTRPVITSELVLVEVLTHFADAGINYRRAAAKLVMGLRDLKNVQVVPLSHEQFDGALALYGERADKAWSLVDCASFLVMRRRRLTDALAHDRHFEQAGFRPLLRRPPSAP